MAAAQTNLPASRDTNAPEKVDSASASAAEKNLPTSPEKLLEILKELEIDYKLYEHEAVFTVEESDKLDMSISGCHCRNLFLRDKKKNMFLVVAANETKLDMKKLAPIIDAGRLSFGSPERLWTHLGVTPGSVCPYAIINDTAGDVKIILDKTMMEAELVNYHPMLNTMTISVKPHDLVKFIESTGHKPYILDLSHAAPDENNDINE